MTNRQRGRTFPLAIALAMALSLLLSPLGHAAAHDLAVPASADDLRHDGSATEKTAHGHSHDDRHDDDWPGDGRTDTTLGHHAADHLHEVPAPADPNALALVCPKDPLCAFPASSPPRGPSFRIERPPRC